MASGLYNRFKYNLMKKIADMSTDTCRVILLNASHVFTASHNVYTDISTNELPTAGTYVVNGLPLTAPTVTQDDVNNCATFDAADVSWAGATFTAYFAAIYDSTIGGNPLVACIDFGGAKIVTSGTFTIQWSTSGIIRLS